jgi:predicted phosphoadenosine phosphosulfate sulfurtransferase
MASTSEYEQQQFWEDSPIEVIIGDNSVWVMLHHKMFEEQLRREEEEWFSHSHDLIIKDLKKLRNEE